MEDNRMENESMEDRTPSNPPNDPAARLRRRAMPILAAGLAVAAAGCTAVSGPETDTVRGILSLEAPESTAAVSADVTGPSEVTEGSIEAPDTVRVGEAFTATIRTVGLNGCWAPAGEDVTVEGLTATVVPFDSTGEREGIACTAALEFLDHALQLAFEEAGEATIEVQGRRVFGLDGAESEPMSLEATVTVVP